MGRKPNLQELIEKFKEGNNFIIDREQYIKCTGIDIPQNRKYTEEKSSVAKKAHEYGFVIKVIPEQLEFIRK